MDKARGKELLSDKNKMEVIIDDPLEWYKVPLEDRAKELIKYHEENKIKGYSYQTKLL